MLQARFLKHVELLYSRAMEMGLLAARSDTSHSLDEPPRILGAFAGTCHNYIGHNYIGHNYIGVGLGAFAGTWLPQNIRWHV